MHNDLLEQCRQREQQKYVGKLEKRENRLSFHRRGDAAINAGESNTHRTNFDDRMLRIYCSGIVQIINVANLILVWYSNPF